MDIKSGSLAAGIYQVILVLFIITRSVTIDTLWSLGFIVFPIINFYFFYRWVRKDTVFSRKQFYLSLMMTYVVYLLIWFLLVTLVEVYNINHNQCPISKIYSKKLKGECQENFLIVEFGIEIPFSAFEIYLIILLRQNYINLRDGAGEVARSLDKSRNLI